VSSTFRLYLPLAHAEETDEPNRDSSATTEAVDTGEPIAEIRRQLQADAAITAMER
jgi:hypothetical protein